MNDEIPARTLLSRIESPDDLRKLDRSVLPKLAEEIRAEIIEVVFRNGGHLGSNLGAVEITLALHRVFDFKTDRLVFDVSHQAYTHKLLTGRRARFKTLRQTGGVTGFCCREESDYDLFTAGHAGTAISAALGMACATPPIRSCAIGASSPSWATRASAAASRSKASTTPRLPAAACSSC